MKVEIFKQIESKFLATGLTKEVFSKEVSFAVQSVAGNNLLQRCTHESLLKSVLNIAQIGLTLNPVAKEAYLVPRYNRNIQSNEAHLEPSYIGLVKLLTDTGSVKSIQTNLVYDGDDFDVNLGTEVEVKHKPFYITGKEKGQIKGVYSIAVLHDGTKQFEYMPKDEIDKIKGRSESFKAFMSKKIPTCIWISDEGEMTRKTCIKRLYKYLPRTDRFKFINEAVNLDNIDYEATQGQQDYIESLLQTCSLEIEEITEIEASLPSLSADHAERLITRLKENQIDPINSGSGYGQKEIHKKLDQKGA